MSNWWEKTQKDIDKLVDSKVATKTDAELRAIDNWINDENLQEKRVEALRENTHKISESNKKLWQDENFRNRRAAALEAYWSDEQNREERRKIQLKLIESPEWQEAHRKGLEALRNDPDRWAEYQENYRKGNTAKYDDPEYWANYYAAIKERDANPEYHKKRLGASKQKVRKPVRTPLGVFETQTDAAKAHGMGNTETMRHRCKSPNFPDYEMISIEEYEKIKGEK